MEHQDFRAEVPLNKCLIQDDQKKKVNKFLPVFVFISNI